LQSILSFDHIFSGHSFTYLIVYMAAKFNNGIAQTWETLFKIVHKIVGRLMTGIV